MAAVSWFSNPGLLKSNIVGRNKMNQRLVLHMVQGWNMTEVNHLTSIYHGCKNLVLYKIREAYFYIRFKTIYAQGWQYGTLRSKFTYPYFKILTVPY